MIITKEQLKTLISSLKKEGWTIKSIYENKYLSPPKSLYKEGIYRARFEVFYYAFTGSNCNYKHSPSLKKDNSFIKSTQDYCLFSSDQVKEDFLLIFDQEWKKSEKEQNEKNIKLNILENEKQVAIDFYLEKGAEEIANFLNGTKQIRNTNKRTQKQLQNIANELIAVALNSKR